MRLEHHLVGGYVRYISPYIIIIINPSAKNIGKLTFKILWERLIVGSPSSSKLYSIIYRVY